MKYPWTLLTVGLLGLSGCVTPPAEPEPPAAPVRPVAPVAPVRAEQITPENARKLSDALAAELDREAQREVTTPPAVPAAPKR
jgi:hypothetical protein